MKGCTNKWSLNGKCVQTNDIKESVYKKNDTKSKVCTNIWF